MSGGTSTSGGELPAAESPGGEVEPLQHPIVGDVYLIKSRAYAVIHAREGHPVVVMSPISGTDEWHVWVRSSKRDWPGFDHEPNARLGLDRPGRFCRRDVTRVSGHVFADPDLCEHRGTLEPEMFKTLMDWWLL